MSTMSTDVLVTTRANKGTNVRPHEQAWYDAAWPIRALLRLSPTLAGRLAARAFCTTWRPPARPEEAALLASARRLEVPFGADRLPAWSFGEGPTVLLSHGWSGRASQLAPLAAALATAGFQAITFDHPAHGEARGRQTTLPAMAQALAAVDAWVGGAHAIVAHSIGTVATTLAIARTIEPRRVVYLAPPIDPRAWLGGFARKLGLGPAIDEPLARRIEALAGMAVDKLDPRAIVADFDTPLLVIHDKDDHEIPFAAGEALAGMWPGAALYATEGLGHYRVLRHPEVGERVIAFLSPLVRG